MREHMRRQCDHIWILDLGGEGRGPRTSENVFAIQTPVAIAVAMRAGKVKKSKAAQVHYARIEGARDAKVVALSAITDFSKIKWDACPDGWQSPFRPAGKGDYFELPLFSDLFPWSGRGIQFSRTWPVAENESILMERWNSLVHAGKEKKKTLLKETRDVRTDERYRSFLTDGKLKSLDSVRPGEKPEAIERFIYRSYDRQWCIADRRVIDMPRPALWKTRSDRQVFLITMAPLSCGQAVVPAVAVPDLNAFRGSCGGLVHPLYRTADASQENLLPGLLELLGTMYKGRVGPEDFLCYVYGMLAQPAFTCRFQKELETRELHVPITKDGTLFEKVRRTGAYLLWLHTYGQRLVPRGKQRGKVPRAAAKCTKGIPSDAGRYPEEFDYNETRQTLLVGEGAFAPVSREVFNFEVSGLRVVHSWLNYRMKSGWGKKSSLLDDVRSECWTSQLTTELLELLWVLELTVETYPKQAELLEAVIAGPCFQADELPSVPEYMRKPPDGASTLFEGIEDEDGD